MTYDTSGFGLSLTVKCSVTFPQGFTVTQFSDDADPFDTPSINLLESAMGVNGDLITWNTANPITLTISVIPGSDDDINLAILFEANRVARGKNSARDIVTVNAVFPDGRMTTYTQGKIVSGMVGNSVAGAGRQKTKTYGFVFENKAEVNTVA